MFPELNLNETVYKMGGYEYGIHDRGRDRYDVMNLCEPFDVEISNTRGYPGENQALELLQGVPPARGR